MSNLGFHHAMRDAGIEVRDDRGRRPLRARGAARARTSASAASRAGTSCSPTRATTGDGLLTALHVMARMVATGAAAGRAGRRSCTGCRRRSSTSGSPTAPRSPPRRAVAAAVAEAEAELGDDGRVLLRPSGTEQLVRVMVEAATQEQADAIARRSPTSSPPPDALRGREPTARTPAVRRGEVHDAVHDRALQPAALDEHLEVGHRLVDRQDLVEHVQLVEPALPARPAEDAGDLEPGVAPCSTASAVAVSRCSWWVSSSSTRSWIGVGHRPVRRQQPGVGQRPDELRARPR